MYFIIAGPHQVCMYLCMFVLCVVLVTNKNVDLDFSLSFGFSNCFEPRGIVRKRFCSDPL